jgi:hypothetical protein
MGLYVYIVLALPDFFVELKSQSMSFQTKNSLNGLYSILISGKAQSSRSLHDWSISQASLLASTTLVVNNHSLRE